MKVHRTAGYPEDVARLLAGLCTNAVPIEVTPSDAPGSSTAGVVLNTHPNIPRGDFDLLKAILNNCLRYGPASQNCTGLPDFRAHLLGRIAHIAGINPRKARRLEAIFQRITW